METDDTKVHVNVGINRKKICTVRVTSIITNRYNKVVSMDITIYKNHKQFNVIKFRPENQKITYKDMFIRLQEMADEHGITRMELPANDKLFEMCDMNEIIEVGNRSLSNLHIYITKEITRIFNDEEKHEIMLKFHVDPSNGQHCGHKKLFAKIRDEFYWRYMTRDIAKFIRECTKCIARKS